MVDVISFGFGKKAVLGRDVFTMLRSQAKGARIQFAAWYPISGRDKYDDEYGFGFNGPIETAFAELFGLEDHEVMIEFIPNRASSNRPAIMFKHAEIMDNIWLYEWDGRSKWVLK